MFQIFGFGELTLPSPKWGDIDESKFHRINRQSRGLDRVIMPDIGYANKKKFTYDFEWVRNINRKSAMNFARLNLGKQVLVTDHNSQSYYGILVSADFTFTQTGRQQLDCRLEIEEL